MKAKVLFYPESKKKLGMFGEIFSSKLDCKSERIPPAYNPENEKLVIIGVTAGKEPTNELIRFCHEINKKRAANVAFYFDAPKNVQTDIMNAVREGGSNVISEVFECKTGGLPFLIKMTDEEKNAASEWCDKVISQLV